MKKRSRNLKGEIWKEVDLNSPYTKDYILEVSNMGRVRSKTERRGTNLIKGSTNNGYHIVRCKFFKPRNKKNQQIFDKYFQEIKKLRNILEWEESNGRKTQIKKINKELNELIAEKDKFIKDEMAPRAIYFNALVHRLVADYFLPEPKKNETVVGHIDFDKFNNKASNLKWMTQEENTAHQQNSPKVIKSKEKRRKNTRSVLHNAKLTEKKVAQIKKLRNEGMPVRTLAKDFKVRENQISRIIRGESWAKVKPAK